MVHDLSYSPNSQTVVDMADLLHSLGCSCNKGEHDEHMDKLDCTFLKTALVSVPARLSRNPFLTCITMYLSSSTSLDVCACKAIVGALVNYQKYLVTLLSIQNLNSELAVIVDKSKTSQNFDAEFRAISQNIPQIFLDAFAEKTQLSINCWTTMPIECRSKLELALLKTSLWENLSNTSLSQPDIECHIENGEGSLNQLPTVKVIEHLLSEISRVVSDKKSSSFDVPLCDSDLRIGSSSIDKSGTIDLSRGDIATACRHAWILESPPSHQARATNPKNLEITFKWIPCLIQKS